MKLSEVAKHADMQWKTVESSMGEVKWPYRSSK
uniref:Uncharacterized protein n=1 Tax=Rhizophora mucronata TaxID=61149 RepID=A0A2P2QJD9_RHIMU